MAERPLISVIIPVYNMEKYLDECMESALNQTYRNTEIFLVDDGSSDRCPEMCDAYEKADSRVRVIHKKNGGQGSARNMALDRVTGSYVAFLDSDDFWDLDDLEYLYDALTRNDADISSCNYRFVKEDGSIWKTRSAGGGEKVYSGVDAMKDALYSKSFGVGPCAKLYRASLWDGVRFPEDRLFEDLAITYRVYHKADRVSFSDAPKLSYRMRPDSATNGSFNRNKISILDTADDILRYCRENCPEAVPAAESRQLASACHLYFQIPQNQLREQADVAERCEKIIRACRRRVMLDKDSRRKTRIGAALSYLGFPLERKIYQLAPKR